MYAKFSTTFNIQLLLLYHNHILYMSIVRLWLTWVRRLSINLVRTQRVKRIFIRGHAKLSAARNRMRSGRVLPEVRSSRALFLATM